jgi:hypothetical protein
MDDGEMACWQTGGVALKRAWRFHMGQGGSFAGLVCILLLQRRQALQTNPNAIISHAA